MARIVDYYAAENWHTDKASTFGESRVSEIRRYLDFTGYVVVLHKHFCGARGATPVAFDDSDLFEEYWRSEVKPGDKLQIWSFPTSEPFSEGMRPNESGEVPINGAY